MVRQATTEVHGGAYNHLQPMDDHALEQMCVPKGHSDQMEISHQSRFSYRAWEPSKDPHWNSLFLKDSTPWKEPMLAWFMKNNIPWEEFTLVKFVENSLPWVGCHAGAEKGCEYEEAAKKMCDEITTPIPSPCQSAKGRGRR